MTIDPENQVPGSGTEPVRENEFDSVVLAAELDCIRQRRKALRQPNAGENILPGDWTQHPEPANLAEGKSRGNLVGLAFSGGGIRSATFNLGVLQRLGELKLLPLVDYLSTVSGGGYIGGWWSSWMTYRAEIDAAEEDFFRDRISQTQASPQQTEHDLSTLCCDRSGWFPKPPPGNPHQEPREVEWLRLYGNYLIPRKGALSADLWRAVTVVARNLLFNQVLLIAVVAVVLLLTDAFYIGFLPDALGAPLLDPAKVFHSLWRWPVILAGSLWLLLAVWFLVIATGNHRQVRRTRVTAWHAGYTRWSCLVASVFALAGFSEWTAASAKRLIESNLNAILGWLGAQPTDAGGLLAALPGLAAGVYAALRRSPTGGGDSESAPEKSVLARLVVKIAPYLFLLTLAVLLSNGLWRLLRATFAALQAGAAWPVHGFAGIAALTFVVLAGALVASRVLDTNPGSNKDPQEALLTVVLLLTIALAGLSIFGTDAELRMAGKWGALLLCLLGAALLGAGLGLGTDPNALSLHGFYRARLVRAYLGATNPERIRDLLRNREEVTEAKRADDQRLQENQSWRNGGPVHLISATLNLVGGSGIVPEQRVAEVFTLAPQYCGSARTGYRPTPLYAGGALTVGTAVAISGAAASPSMGRLTSTPLAMLMTFFNVRLGYWIANPEKSAWRMPWTRLWLWHQLQEFFSQTTALRRFCFLSDGGHLENLGLYPLIRRRCRFIIVCDASADPQRKLDDLANAVRMVRADFACEIEFAPGSLEAIRESVAGSQTSRCHSARATIRYADGSVGTLIYLKSSLTGDEPADVLAYARENLAFPHQTTADQFFDEAQFESYRRLGYHIAGEVFAALDPAAARQRNLTPWQPPADPNADLRQSVFNSVREPSGSSPSHSSPAASN